MLSELKSFSSAAKYETEELVALSGFGRALENEYNELKLDAPEWLPNQQKAVRRELKARNAEAIANKLRSAKARLETLKSPDEKRKAVEDEIAALEKQATDAA